LEKRNDRLNDSTINGAEAKWVRLKRQTPPNFWDIDFEQQEPMI
jgi:hypothetical protein